MWRTNSRKIHALRNSLSLSERQHNILIGSLLGDGCLIPNSGKKDYRLQIEQNEAHKTYVYWMYEEFKEFVLSEPRYHSRVRSWKFRTISHPDLTAIAQNFYPNGKKILPANIQSLVVDPIVLAVWAGDGFTFNTQSFTRAENEMLQKCLAENFSLYSTSLHKDKDRVRLYIKGDSLQRLRSLIENHILPEFTYKLPVPRRDLVLFDEVISDRADR